MAVTISRYNHTAKLITNKEIDYTALKFMLLDSNAAFDATDTTLTDVLAGAATEVSGNGWDAGGEALASVAITTVSTSGAMLDAADISVTATGGNIGPASAGCIYDSAHVNDAPLWYIDFDGPQEAGVGTDFKVTFNANGIFRITNPA